jgi:hypothetical protein
MSLLTRAESSGYRETSLHADVLTFVTALAGRGDRRIHLSSFGASPQGRELPLLVLSAHGVRTPDEARRLQLPIVLVINGIHAGEVEGKEAAMMLMRDLLDGAYGDLLAHLTLVVVPLFNPDGNDAVDPTNRALDLAHLTGQDGPARVGTRVNASGINLNRDYMRQAAPEMQQLQQRVCQVWQPDLTIDTHATNGSVHRMAMTYDVPHTVDSGRGEPIAYMRERMMPAVQAAVEQHHGLLSGWYGNFVEDERVLDGYGTADPDAPVREGWMTYPHNPRFGSNYRGLSGRLDLLLECYSYLTFEERVRTTYAFLLESLRHVAGHAADVMNVVAAAEAPRDRIAVRYQLEAFAEPLTIPTRSPRTREGEPSTVAIPYFGRFAGSTVVDRPAGYVVPAAVGEHLRLHGLPVTPLDAGATLDVEVATVEAFGGDGGRRILEAAGTGDIEVSWKTDRRAAPDHAWLVRTDHRLAAVAVYLCEPRSDDGVVENGVIGAPAQGAEFPIWRLLA